MHAEYKQHARFGAIDLGEPRLTDVCIVSALSVSGHLESDHHNLAVIRWATDRLRWSNA